MKNTKLYSLSVVDNYINDFMDKIDVDIIPGSLIDTYILYHARDLIEVFEEIYVNEWTSAYARHIYRKGLPKRFITALNEQ